MTENKTPATEAVRTSITPEIEPKKRESLDPRNLIHGGEGLAAEASKKPLSFSDVDTGVFPDNDEGDEPSPKTNKGKKPSGKEASDDEFEDEDLEDDLDEEDPNDDDDDLDELEEELDEEEGDEEAEEEEESEETDETTEDEAGSEDDSKVIQVKVNGKFRKYTLKQMKDMVSSGAHLVEQREAFKAETEQWKQDFETNKAKLVEADRILAPIWQATQKKDVQGAVIEAFALQGVTKVQAKWTLIEQMVPVVSQILGIAPEALRDRIKEREPIIRQMQMKDENDYFKEQSSKPPPADSQVDESAGQKEVERFLDEKDISRNQLRKAVKWLKENTYKGKEDQISLDVIGKFVDASNAIDKAVFAIKAVRPSLAGDEKFVDRVINLAKRKPDWSADKVARWVEKKARSFRKTQRDEEVTELRKDVSRKVLKANNKSALKKDSPSSQRKPKRFNDLYGNDGESLDI